MSRALVAAVVEGAGGGGVNNIVPMQTISILQYTIVRRVILCEMGKKVANKRDSYRSVCSVTRMSLRFLLQPF